VCILRDEVKVVAVFESDNKVYCKFKGHLDMSSLEDFPLSISNDFGSSRSNQVSVRIVRNLPQILKLVYPLAFETNKHYDIQLKGINFNELSYFGLKVQLRGY
jgi:hypothetical protein